MFAKHGYRPVLKDVLAEFQTFPTPTGLFTIVDLGGWPEAWTYPPSPQQKDWGDANGYAARHQGGANYAFMDGHVKFLKAEIVRRAPHVDLVLGTSNFRSAVDDLEDLARRGGRILRVDRTPPRPPMHPTIDRVRGALTVAAAAYLALLPSNALSFWRSLAFASAAFCTAWLIVAMLRAPALRVPLPGRAIPLALAGWSLWSIVSLAWSIDPAFTAGELKSDLAWGLVLDSLVFAAEAEIRWLDHCEARLRRADRRAA